MRSYVMFRISEVML